MPNTAEKNREADLEHDAIERFLREEVVKIYDAVKADPSRCTPLEESWATAKAIYRAKHGI